MKEKQMYASPHVEAVELTPGGTLLTGSQTEKGGIGMYVGGGEIIDFNWGE